ncbi:MAG TPA: hypothetical protein VKB26_09945 [Candidatus Acidoferrales bacterium]|nr:hypothetical protein [Candidatus Acidoferrales bacterium]
MQKKERRIGAAEWLILIGGCVFVLVLAVSAYFEADIRWLHFFQAWMYLAAMALGLRRNRWGYFIGISAAGLWDYANIVATSFFWDGLQQLGGWIHSGHVDRPDLLIAVPAWFSNLLLIIGCVWAYSRLKEKSGGDIVRFVICCALTTGFFAGDMAIFQPRYLEIFRGLLHPHLPW